MLLHDMHTEWDIFPGVVSLRGQEMLSTYVDNQVFMQDGSDYKIRPAH